MVDTKIGGMEGGDLGASPAGTEEFWLQNAAGGIDFFWPVSTMRTYALKGLIRYVQITVIADDANNVVADGQAFFHVPVQLNGTNLVEVHAEVIVAGTTGTQDIQIRNVTQAGVNMLTTEITIDTGETGSDEAAIPPVIDAANDDVATNDLIAIDVDVVHTTPAKGLIVTMGFQTP